MTLILAPILWQWGYLELDGLIWTVDSLGSAWIASFVGVGLLFLSLNLLNGLALLWRCQRLARQRAVRGRRPATGDPGSGGPGLIPSGADAVG